MLENRYQENVFLNSIPLIAERAASTAERLLDSDGGDDARVETQELHRLLCHVMGRVANIPEEGSMADWFQSIVYATIFTNDSHGTAELFHIDQLQEAFTTTIQGKKYLSARLTGSGTAAGLLSVHLAETYIAAGTTETVAAAPGLQNAETSGHTPWEEWDRASPDSRANTIVIAPPPLLNEPGMTLRRTIVECIRATVTAANNSAMPKVATNHASQMSELLRKEILFCETLLSSAHSSFRVSLSPFLAMPTRQSVLESTTVAMQVPGALRAASLRSNHGVLEDTILVPREHVIESMEALAPVVFLFCSAETISSYIYIIHTLAREFENTLPLAMVIREGESGDGGVADDAVYQDLDSIKSLEKVGAVVSVSWESETFQNLAIGDIAGRPADLDGDNVRSWQRGPLAAARAMNEHHATIGAVTLALALLGAWLLETGTFFFLWALVFANMLEEEAGFRKAVQRYKACVTRRSIYPGRGEEWAHPAMVVIIGVCEVLYSFENEKMTKVARIYAYTVTVITVALLLSVPAYRYLSEAGRNLAQRINNPRRDMSTASAEDWNRDVLDPGATVGLRCGGVNLVSGVAVIEERFCHRRGGGAAASLGHTLTPAGTVFWGRVVSVGNSQAAEGVLPNKVAEKLSPWNSTVTATYHSCKSLLGKVRNYSNWSKQTLPYPVQTKNGELF